MQSRSLLCPRGCVPGQGLCRLPGSALSVPGELPRALRGDVWGEGAPGRAGQGRAGQGRAGQGRGFLLTELLPGAGGSQLRCTKGHSQGFCKGGNKAGIFHFLFVGKGEGWSCKLWTHP